MREVAAGRFDPWLLGVLALGGAWWIVALGAFGAGTPAPLDDVWEYGLVARHLVAGEGFRTGVIHPPLWDLLDARRSVPVLVHGPLLPLLLVPVAAAAPAATIPAIPWIAAGFATLAAGLLHRLGRRFVAAPVAATAAAWFTLSPLALRTVTHDAAFAIGAFWLILAIERRIAGRPLAAGLAIGAGTLVRPELIFAGIVLAAATPGARLRVAAGVAALWAPWAWHSTVSSGVPFFNLSSYLLLAFTPAHPELSVLRAFDLPPTRWTQALWAELPSLPAKWWYAAPRALKHLLAAPTLATGWLALVGFATLRRRAASPDDPAGARATGTIAVLAALLAIPLALMVAAQHRPDFVMPFLPLWALAAALGASALLGWAGVRRPAALPALALLAIAPSALLALRDQARSAHAHATWIAAEQAALAGRFAPAGAGEAPVLIFSDAPDFVSWTTGQPTAWVTAGELERLYRAAAAGSAPLPRHLPGRREEARTWFHEDLRRLPQPDTPEAGGGAP